MPGPLDRFISIEQLRQQIPLSLSSLKKLTASGEISSVRIGLRRLYVADQVAAELCARGGKGPAYRGKV